MVRIRAYTHSMCHRSKRWPLILSEICKPQLMKWICPFGLRIAQAIRQTRRKKRQRAEPPHILLTTPESLALLISYPDAPKIFSGLKRIVIDEIHALAESKRGDQLMLALSRLQSLCPDLRRVGLSATVDDPDAIAKTMAAHPDSCPILFADPGPAPDIQMLIGETPPPWAGAGAAYSVPMVLEQIEKHKTTLIFHNTREKE